MTPSAGTASALSSHFQALFQLRQILLDHTCSHLNPPINPPVVLHHSLNLRSALALLLSNGLSSVPLLDQSNQLAGSFSLSDALYIFCILNPIAASPDQESVLSTSTSLTTTTTSTSASPPSSIAPPQNHTHASRKLNPQPLSLNSNNHTTQTFLKSQNEFFQLPLSRIIDLRPGSLAPPLHIHPQATLLDAGEHLYRSHHRRIPLVDIHPITGQQTLKRIITPHTLLHFLATHPRAALGRLSQSVGSLRIGSQLPSGTNISCLSSLPGSNSRTPNPLVAAVEQNSIRELVRIFLHRSVGAVPIIDQSGGVVDVYELVDVVDLFSSPKQPQRLFDLTVRQAIALRTRKVTGITFCSSKDSLGNLLKYSSENFVRMFVVVDNDASSESRGARPTRTRKSAKRNKVKDKLVGMITLPDILDHLLGCQPPTLAQHEPSLSSAQPHQQLLSTTSSAYSSSLVSCSSKTSSVSFCSPTNTLSCSASNRTGAPNNAQSATPLSISGVSNYLPPLNPKNPLVSSSHLPPSATSRPISSTMDSSNSSYFISRSQPLPDLGCSRIKRQDMQLNTYQPNRQPSIPVSHLRTPENSTTSKSNQCPHPPPMNKIAEFAAQMMCYLWFAEPSSLNRAPAPNPTRDHNSLNLTLDQSGSGSAANGSPISSGSINQAQLIPNPEFVVFVHNLLSTTQVSHSVVLLALYYIHKLKLLNPIKPNAKSEYRIGVVSLMLANKMLDDHTYTAKTWSEVSRLPLSSLNDGEIEFLQGLNFELHVNVRDFNAWFRLLHGMVHLKDRHTAAALAAGPRTRWFKKMRIVSGEGLSVLEGLVSPIRNSKMMKIEVDKEKKQPVVAVTPKSQSTNGAESQRIVMNTCQPVRGCQPNHPYNLRRSARGLMPTPTSATSAPIRVIGWTGGAEGSSSGRLSVYSSTLPSTNLLPLSTPNESSRPINHYEHSLPLRQRSVTQQTVCAPKTTNFSGKRNYSEIDYAENEESYSTQNPSKRSGSLSLNGVHRESSQTPTRLPPIVLSQDASGNPTYLGAAIIPSSSVSGHQAGQGAELYFHSLAAGRRTTEQAIRQEVSATQQKNGDGGVYVFGSQPWRKGTPMDEGSGTGVRCYSNFSNAGLPGVVWAEGTILGKPNELISNSNPASSNCLGEFCYLSDGQTHLPHFSTSNLTHSSSIQNSQVQY